MNLSQTRQVLSYLWTTHPSAPKLTDDDKMRSVASYFRVLYRFAIDDVLDAVDKACRKSPSFVPSAYEIEAECAKNPNVEPYLPREYYELDEQFKEYACCYYQDLYLAQSQRDLAETDEEREKCQKRVDGIRARMDIEVRMHDIYDRALSKAINDYDRQQADNASHDLRMLGYERLALEG